MKLSFVLLLSLLIGIGTPKLTADVPEPSWTQSFTFDLPPRELNSRWKKFGKGLSAIENDALMLSTSGDESVYWWFTGDSGDSEWDPTRPTTVEFQAEIEGFGPEGHGAVVVIADGRQFYSFFLQTAPMKTYRIILAEGAAELFEREEGLIERVKGQPIHREKGNPHYFYFGDGSERVEGISRWKYIRWTNEGAFPFSP